MAPYLLIPLLLSVLLQSIPVWRLVRDLRIGSADDPELAFTGVFDVVVRGDVAYSVHENEQRLRMWNKQGRLIKEIGRNGQGPGEFAGPVSAGWRGDTLWVYDSRQARISLFTPDGQFVRSIRPIAKRQPGAKMTSNIVGRYLLADGTVLAQPTLYSAQASDKRTDLSALLRINESGDILDTLVVFPVRQSTLELKSGTSAMYSAQPFTDSPIGAVDGKGRAVYVINRDYARDNARSTFRITKISLTGDTLYDKRFEYRPKPVTDAQFEKLVTERVDMATEKRGPRPALYANRSVAENAVRNAMVRPRFHPPISRAAGGADGTLWLQREDDGGAERLWQVVDENGRFIAAVRIPRDDRVHYATRNVIWVSQTDELDVPYLTRYRVTPARTR